MAATLGAGTVTTPYVVTKVGVLGAAFMMVVGMLLSKYSAILLVKCSDIVGVSMGAKTYEDFAEVAWGARYRKVTAICTMTGTLGFAAAYVSLSKTLIPTILG